MAYNGSGTFLINTAGQPVVAGTVISSTTFNSLTADLATGLSTVITKDGQTTVTANIPMASFKFTGLGVGSAAGDSANLSQVQSTVTKLLASVSGADTVTATASPTLAAYAAGQMFYFVAAGDNTTSVTLNIDALGAKAVTRDGSVALAAADIKSGEVVVVVYDGTRFQVVSQLNSAGNATFANVSITSALNVGGVATFSAGSAAAPSITTTGDTNTGLFFPAADTIAFTEGGVESMRISSSGNLGLGVTPSAWGLGKAIDVNTGSAVWGVGNDQTQILTNAYFDGTDFKYKNTATSSRYRMDGNSHQWFNAPSGTAGNAITFTQAMTLDASGNLALGATSADSGYRLHVEAGTSHVRIKSSTTSAGAIPKLNFFHAGNDEFAIVGGSYLGFLSGGATERCRITSAGDFLVAKTSTGFTNGVSVEAIGVVNSSRNGGPSGYFNRNADDGQIVVLLQAGIEEGNISVSGTTVSYNGGHLSRYSQTTNNTQIPLLKGTVMTNLDQMAVWEKDGQPLPNEQLNCMKVSDVEGDVNVAGVFVNWDNDDDVYINDMNIAMTGDMVIRVAQGVVVQRGDLLMSAGDGTAKPQGDDIIRSKTVAKVTSNYVTCTYEDGSYCVPCVLMAC